VKVIEPCGGRLASTAASWPPWLDELDELNGVVDIDEVVEPPAPEELELDDELLVTLVVAPDDALDVLFSLSPPVPPEPESQATEPAATAAATSAVPATSPLFRSKIFFIRNWSPKGSICPGQRPRAVARYAQCWKSGRQKSADSRFPPRRVAAVDRGLR